MATQPKPRLTALRRPAFGLALVAGSMVATAPAAAVAPSFAPHAVQAAESVAARPPAPPAAPAAEASGAACISYRAESRYQNYGYDHWVHLTSRCAEARRCHVTTQSNPSGVHLSLAAGASASELLFRGSPASEPGASVRCDANR